MNIKKISFSVISLLILGNQAVCQAVSFAGVKKSVNNGIEAVRQTTKDSVDWIKDNKKKTAINSVIIAGLILYIVKNNYNHKMALDNLNKRQIAALDNSDQVHKNQIDELINAVFATVDKFKNSNVNMHTKCNKFFNLFNNNTKSFQELLNVMRNINFDVK